ncbi:Adenosylmethionine-8-amino-7-oxononanoate aminotransferase [Piscirickettsia salmonis]|uniref:Adenosylmethionine-8-amino-7-oxononanoate aminotransferase n=2 Tax=Piscirickettsia salmonis TaxID=1238 RepID=A0A1L6TFP1_PISSA|nr:adenosylmethionine--8-amino-7-oxononanoate transaminase [Piscirickettsia salmonis]AKP72226.1 adenosylmethionine-8-amino-7-oxononanoate aminotransferase [Piscirickettsia salmonis LF-89 = ATCC VR-1361]ALB24337.1 adenosylmethionine--8-amino-7-oxononanoate transaminase [Piscirickettsia salmonis]ALY04128.1 adenosylmethionine-8-amino-7-oxononanoate aminotransferase [Piscirickettsia salmonis]AMA43683.1 adenosylmethionine-8-amino-7-oxononanoate aminotransferase [Piscirickettsia salmonis]AOS36150.1 
MSLVTRDLKHIWHPCSQMKDYETFSPLEVIKAQGCYLTLADGRKIIDVISSWWCKSFGHNHPYLTQALKQQLEKFEHVILANTTNHTIVALSETLAKLQPGLDKVMYASDGSCAVEIAMKMSLHSRVITGQTEQKYFAALKNGYHGETLATLSVSDLGLYKAPYQSACLNNITFIDVPYVRGPSDPLWHDSAMHWQSTQAQLDHIKHQLTAILVEPIAQGAGGMLVYSADFLKRLAHWCKTHDIHLIADEIMTGLGRTGYPLACQHAGITPDFICLSKGLTAGYLPMSAVLTSNNIYQLFYDDYETGKAFMHSHTHSGNALAAAVALATQELLNTPGFYQEIQEKGQYMYQLLKNIAEQTDKLKNLRNIGMIAAADLVVPNNDKTRWGYLIYQQAIQHGALLRPLGNSLYWLPPLTITKAELKKIASITALAIETIL